MPDEQHFTLSHLEIPVQPIQDNMRYALDLRLQPWIARHCGIAEGDVLSYTIRRRSLDARRKPDIRLVYELEVTVREGSMLRDDATIARHTPAPDQQHPLYHLPLLPALPQHPIIVGSGPAGMMAAYLFALYGCQPLILERGFEVEQRGTDIKTFLHTRQLHPDSNYLVGEGGAGTYSDGKLYTRMKDDRIPFLLEAYIAARAPRRILYEQHPHIGSDILPYMVKRLRKQIEAWGGTFRWGVKVSDIVIRHNRCCGVVLKGGEQLEAPLTLIAPGHSARDLIRTLVQHGIAHRPKDFQIGCRIEHPQAMIDQAQYGWHPPRQLVGAAEYNLVSRPQSKNRRHPVGKLRSSPIKNVATFCMCPGGEIIPGTSDPGHLSTNGMSPFLRDGLYANAGLIVNQEISRFPSALDAFGFLSDLEQRAFMAGGQTYACPAQSARTFVRGEAGLHTTAGSYRLGVTPARLDRLLPQETVTALCEALKYFERLIPGFLQHGVLLGVETRVSSPVRFGRDPATLSSSLPGLYLAGEGAGYASGIVSSALDGLRIVETILTGALATRKISV